MLSSLSKLCTIANTRKKTMQTENKKPYLAVYHEVLCAESVTNKSTGVALKWNLQERVFYCWMLSEYEAFKKLDKEMYHNMDVIAGRLALNIKSVERYVKTFCDFGLITKTKVKYQGGVYSNSYVVHNVFNGLFVLNNALKESDKSMHNLIDSASKSKPAKDGKQITKPKIGYDLSEDLPF